MPYWIHEDGELIGPMRAIDVLRRARPSLQVSDGENWFQVDSGQTAGDGARGDSDSGVFQHPATHGANG
jgi:hypothetical protein